MNKLLPILLVVVLSGCTTLNQVNLPSGDKVLVIYTPYSQVEGVYNKIYQHCMTEGYTIFKNEKTYNSFGHTGFKTAFACGKNKPVPKEYQDE